MSKTEIGPAASSSWKSGKITTPILRIMADSVGKTSFQPDHDAGKAAASTSEAAMSRLQIVFPLYPGVTHLDFTGPHQVLTRMPDADIVVASVGGRDIEAEGLTFAR